MKHYKPTSKSRRNMTGINYREFLTASKPEKSLTKGFKRGAGRAGGFITTRHKGGGHKRLFRFIDFSYDKIDVPYVIKTIEYDPEFEFPFTDYYGYTFEAGRKLADRFGYKIIFQNRVRYS